MKWVVAPRFTLTPHAKYSCSSATTSGSALEKFNTYVNAKKMISVGSKESEGFNPRGAFTYGDGSDGEGAEGDGEVATPCALG